jgi:peptide deformylase
MNNTNMVVTAPSALQVYDKPTKEAFRFPLPDEGNVLPLLKENDPLLGYESLAYDFSTETKEDTLQLVLDLGASLRYHNGIGLSACQVGIMKKVFVIETGDELPLAIFNPSILDENTPEVAEEGCLSFFQLIVKVERPTSIRIRFQDANGITHTTKFEGLSAKVVSHEVDHLLGYTMKDKVSKLRWEQALKARKKRLK